MKVTWTLLRVLLGFGLLALSLGNQCNVTNVNHCYESLVHYEGLGFPLYGEDALELEETCSMMNDSFECVERYLDACKDNRECGEECQEMIEDIDTFSQNTGLRDVQKALCDTRSVIREAYLENYSCLERNANNYASCHNDSQMSQEFMSTILDPVQGRAARCCFFTWYHDCFTNITRETCNENATFFVSFTIHTLIAHVSLQICGPNPEMCERPPLPSTNEDNDGHKDKDDHEDKNDHGDKDDHEDKDGHGDKTDEIDPLGGGHYNLTDVDNSLEETHKSSATFHANSLQMFGIALFWILLSKYVL